MRTVRGSLTIAALLSAGVLAQTRAPQPAFDAAEIHVRPHSADPNPYMTGGALRGGRYDLRNGTMLDLITMAYGMDGGRGPRWTELAGPDALRHHRQGAGRDLARGRAVHAAVAAR